MKLIIGGAAQGKSEYVCLKYGLSEDAVWDGILPLDGAWPGRAGGRGAPLVINHFHLWVRKRILEGGCPEEEIVTFLDRCKDCIIVCDEIGNGIVPVDLFEREYRERVGRILVRLAKSAEEVERVLCGIGIKIK